MGVDPVRRAIVGAGTRALVAGLAVLVFASCAWLERPASEAAPPVSRPEPAVDPAAPVLVLRGAHVMTAAGPTLAGADVLVRGERIEAVGPGLAAPEGATVVDAAGRWITPGLIDSHSHIGVYAVPYVPAHADGNEMTGPFKPEVRAIDGFWPQDPTLDRALAGGVTAIHVLPGSANLIGGQGATLSTRRRLSASEMRLPGSPTTLKMACGENPKRLYGAKGQAPGSRMAEVAMLRAQLDKARVHSHDPNKPRDFGMEALAGALSGEVLIENHCYRAEEMLLRLELFGEYGIAPRAFHHAVEAYKIAPQLARAGVGAAVWADWWGVKMELLDAVPANAAILHAAGVRVAIKSDSPDDVQRLNQEAAKALAAGQRAGIDVDRDDAIRWITANAAWVAGVEAQTGTLEPGKRADLVIWDRDPFSVYARTERVYIAGELVYERGAEGLPGSDFELGVRRPPGTETQPLRPGSRP